MKSVNPNVQVHPQGSVWLHQDSSEITETASDAAMLPPIALANDHGHNLVDSMERLPRRPMDPVVEEMLRAFKFMQENEDALDQKVAAFIRSSRQFKSKLFRMTRLGVWYMEDGLRLVQCCVVRLYLRTSPDSCQLILREFAIPVGDPATTTVSVRKDKG